MENIVKIYHVFASNCPLFNIRVTNFTFLDSRPEFALALWLCISTLNKSMIIVIIIVMIDNNNNNDDNDDDNDDNNDNNNNSEHESKNTFKKRKKHERQSNWKAKIVHGQSSSGRQKV